MLQILIVDDEAIIRKGMNLSPYRADFFNPHIHMLSMNKWDIQVRALTPLNILSFS